MVAYGLFLCLVRGTRFAAASKAPESFRSVHTQQVLGKCPCSHPSVGHPLPGLPHTACSGNPGPSFLPLRLPRFHGAPLPAPRGRVQGQGLQAQCVCPEPFADRAKTTRLSKTVSPSALPDSPCPSKSSSGAAFLRRPEAYGHGHAREEPLPVPDGAGRLPAAPKGSASDAAPIRRTVCL